MRRIALMIAVAACVSGCRPDPVKQALDKLCDAYDPAPPRPEAGRELAYRHCATV